MKIIDSITDKNEWLMYLQHKIDGENIRREERKKLERYIKEEKYTYLKDKITEGEFFSALPVKKMVNKEGSKKSRVVYSFEDEINIPLKFIAFKLHKYDNRLSDNCYSFRQGYGVKNAINKIKRNNKIKSMFCYKIDISNYFNSIDPDTLLDRISFLKEEDEEIYRLFRSMLLNNNVVINGSIISENHGAMAGIPVSPFFANFYLAESDRKFQDALYFRYSDDIIIFAESEEELDKYRKILSEVIYESKLKFNYDKEIIANPLDKWEFLGFSYDDGIIDISENTKRKIKSKIKRKADALRRWQRKKNLTEDKAAIGFIRSMNYKFFGGGEEDEFTWSRWFFGNINTDKSLREIDSYMQEYIRYIITGRHYKGNYRIKYETMKKWGYLSLVNEYYKRQKNSVF